MSIKEALELRSGNCCELCTSSSNLDIFEVAPSNGTVEESILVCDICKGQLDNLDTIDANHWHCLNDSMWSEVDAVKVVAYRLLSILKNQELLDMMYLEDDVLNWAKQGLVANETKIIHRDSNGVILTAGDTVTIIKDLEVKGAGFTAKRGTAVRNISLAHDDEEHIEGRVNGTKIMLMTKYLKKQ